MKPIPQVQCSCGKSFDTAQSFDGSPVAPKKGDVNFCYYCGKIYIFDDDGNQHRATQEELAKIKGENAAVWAVILKAQRIITTKNIWQH